MLKELLPGGFDKAYGYWPPTAAAANPITFMYNEEHFKNNICLAKLGALLAEQAQNTEEVSPDPFTKAMLAGIIFLETKVHQLPLDTTNLSATHRLTGKTFTKITVFKASNEAQNI